MKTTTLIEKVRKMRENQRDYIGFELNPEYIKIAQRRIINELGLFA